MPEILLSGEPSSDSVILMGNSHLWALYGSWRNRNSSDVDAGYIPRDLCMIYSTGSLCPGPRHSLAENEEYWDRAIAVAANRVTVVSWLGNQASQFLFRDAAQFSACPAGYVYRTQDAGENCLFVPTSMLEAFFESKLDYEGGRLADVLSRLSVSKRVFLCGTPPPKSVETILRNLKNEPAYNQAAITNGFETIAHSVTPLLTRIALWQAQQAAFANACRTASIEFVPVPIDACEKDGSLKDIYSADDVTHANIAFGSLMWKEVMRKFHE